MLPERAVERRLLAGARRGPARRDRRARLRRRRAVVARRLPPLADPLRRAARLRPRSTGSSPAPSAAAGAVGRAAAASRERSRPAARGRRDARARSPRVAPSRVRVRPRRPRRGGAAPSADRVAPADRAPDDRRQRAGRASCSPSARLPALYRVHERPEPERVELPGRAARVARRADPAAPEHAVAAAGRRPRRRESRGSSPQHVRRTGHGGAALTSLVLRSLKQARYGPRTSATPGLRLDALLPLHLADPALSRPGLPPRAAVGDRRRGGGAAAPARPRGRSATWTSARERDAMTIERDADDVARCFLLERELVEPAASAEFDGRGRRA